MDRCFRFCRRVAIALMAMFVLGVSASVVRADAITLPTTGVDLPGTVDATVTLLGAAVAAIVLAYAAFKTIKMALRWFGRVGG